MKIRRRIGGVVVLVCALGVARGAEPGAGYETVWHQWRGPLGSGEAPYGDPPVEWSESKHIKWKVAVPGQGHATPIVWGDRVYIQTAIPAATEPDDAGDDDGGQPQAERRPGPSDDGDPIVQQDRGRRERDGRRGRGQRGGRGGRGGPSKPSVPHKFAVIAYDRDTGQEVWQRVVREEVPHDGTHRDGSQCPSSPVTDGERLYAYFGSRGLYCMDMDGKVLWERDFGDQQTRHGFGEGSSPALYGDVVVVNWDHEGDSMIFALDKKTGKDLWKKPRDERTTWGTPLVVEVGGKPQVIVTGTNRIRAYDLKSGDVVWECGGLGANAIPSPIERDGVIYAMSGYRDPALLAIRLAGAKGDITGTEHVLWSLDKGTSYVPSPLLHDGVLYFVERSSGVLSCVDAKTGKVHYDNQRVDGLDAGVYSSIVGAKGRVYIVGRDGTTVVLRHGTKLEPLATNKLDDEFAASPAIVGDRLYLRGYKHLYCVAAN